ncbi:alpha,alpha-trehalose-phosphate synthase (UDP-forming) [Actibacterium ureilyticum]|uniref:alpha,alpha-trehalose-phosphate synthase (UDP-forming) n=1 Tax=Actibacterium ureilyticum TaxID=1590614 RepID=UPI000BAB1AC0|nr:trehalose-6-phosphate synthase [Actibacterium ureilyticum]
MNRLIVISHRAPDPAGLKDSGGMVVALKNAMQVHKGIWVGCAPTTREPDQPDIAQLDFFHGDAFDIAYYHLSEDEHAGFYTRYSNSVIWPAFHGRLDLIDPEGNSFATYNNVARKIAQALRPHIRPDDLIWVQDYQLIPVAGHLRALGVRNKMGFFLHIPFPARDVIMAIPHSQIMLRGFCDYDLIGFQSKRDIEKFSIALRSLLDVTPDSNNRFQRGGRTIQIGHFPISIDVEEFSRFAHQNGNHCVEGGSKGIIAVDRLDYSKGLLQRLRGFRQFLADHPEHYGQVTLTQIAQPTREHIPAYRSLKTEVEQLVSAINGQYGGVEWVPVHYVNKRVSRERVAGLLRSGKGCLVTPLADGMNLVAKEFVVAQDPADPGVLILSMFAGASEELSAALLVNPYDTGSIAAATERAISMPIEERRARHADLLKAVQSNSIGDWSRNYLAALQAQAITTAPQPVEFRPKD